MTLNQFSIGRGTLAPHIKTMSSNRIVLLSIGAAVGFGFFAWHEFRMNQSQSTEVNALHASNTHRSESLRLAKDHLTALNRTVTQRANKSSSSSSDRSGKRIDAASVWQRAKAQDKDPRIQLAQIALLRSCIGMKYGSLFRTLGLIPEKVAKFEDNVAKHETDFMDGVAAANAQGLSTGDPAFDALMRSLNSKIDADYSATQQALLGNDGYRQLQNYDRTVQVRGVVSSLAGAAAVAGVAFTDEQAEQLVDALAASNSDYRGGKTATIQNIDWNLADRQASAFLSDSQLAFFKTFASQDGVDRYSGALFNEVHTATAAEKAAPQSPGITSNGG